MALALWHLFMAPWVLFQTPLITFLLQNMRAMTFVNLHAPLALPPTFAPLAHPSFAPAGATAPFLLSIPPCAPQEVMGLPLAYLPLLAQVAALLPLDTFAPLAPSLPLQLLFAQWEHIVLVEVQ